MNKTSRSCIANRSLKVSSRIYGTICGPLDWPTWTMLRITALQYMPGVDKLRLFFIFYFYCKVSEYCKMVLW